MPKMPAAPGGEAGLGSGGNRSSRALGNGRQRQIQSMSAQGSGRGEAAQRRRGALPARVSACAPMADVSRMCFNPSMSRSAYAFISCVALAIMSLVGGCNRPVPDPAKLKAIRTESQALMTQHPVSAGGVYRVPQDDWPPVLRSLHPEMITVYHWGVDVRTKAYFDGGWGYNVPRNKRDLPMLASCYSEPSPGVFWHGPC